VTWRVDNSRFPWMHRARAVFSQLEVLLPAPPSGGIPSISTARAQALCRFAQVIHMLMHTIGQQCCCRACVTRRPRWTLGPGADEMAQEGTDAGHRFTGRAARVSTGCLPVMLILRRGPPEHPGLSLSSLRYHSHELERADPPPPGSAAGQGPRLHPVMATDIAAAHSGSCRRAVTLPARTFRPGTIR